MAWRAALERRAGPTCLILTRQDVPSLERSADQVALIGRGGYILSNSDAEPQITLIGTGSEVQLAVGAAKELEASGVAVRVVSLPSTEVFDAQDPSYRGHVLPPGGARVIVEAGATGGWWRYAGERGAVVGIDHFGLSAPGDQVLEHFGFTVAKVVEAARRLL